MKEDVSKIPAVVRQFDKPMADLNGKNVVVTGGTGSFGRAFVQTVIDRYTPKKLIIFSRDEAKQYDMSLSWPDTSYPFMRYFLGDVRDRDRLDMAFYDVDIVVHAAALKQVPAAEYNPFEFINTNVIGAENIVQAAIRNRVRKVIALSTDKAANPINLYGASKLASDKIFTAGNNLSGDGGPLFSVVRYGNVVGSRGSVVPLFNRLLTEGATELPITDERMTRFWITLEAGVNFVLSSLVMMQGGEIFVPKIPSMKVADLARAIAPDVPHRIIGIRPGEKLHEVMIPLEECRSTLELDDRYAILPPIEWYDRASLMAAGARGVPEDFIYTSDGNSEWLDAEDLRAMLAE